MRVVAEPRLGALKHEQDFSELDSDFDLVRAVGYYMDLRKKLQSCIDEYSYDTSTPPILEYNGSKELESWIQGFGQVKFGYLISFQRLALEHAQFHKLVGDIVAKLQAGAYSDAEALLKNEFSQSTRRLLVEIGELNEVIRSEDIAPT